MLRQLATFVSSNLVRHGEPSRWVSPSATTVCGWTRSLSSSPSRLPRVESNHDNDDGVPRIVIESQDGRKFSVLDSRQLPKLKPAIVRRRLDRLKTYVGTEKNIRHSPWRLNLICQMIAGLPVQEAVRQLTFCEKTRAPLVKKVLKNTVHQAQQKDGLKPSQLEVAECFATKGTPLKRIKPMARGR